MPLELASRRGGEYRAYDGCRPHTIEPRRRRQGPRTWYSSTGLLAAHHARSVALRDFRGRLRFALLSDFEPKGEVARAYGVYRKGEGVSERALFVIDGEGIVRWSYVSPIGINPGAEGILDALEGMEKVR